MVDTRIGRIAGFLIGAGILVAALVMVRVHRPGVRSEQIVVNPVQTGEILHDRMAMERELMRQERLDLSSR
uniref:Uncharacterized protein n=1 Tax=candidate division WOR-3 bacterium TaxID=2052148 RepID=A0A7C4C9W4_UNCW3